MSDQRFTAEELRRAHESLQDDLLHFIESRVHEFQCATGLDVQSISIRSESMERLGLPTRSIITGVDVRVGLGR